MARILPKSVTKLIEALRVLPGVGERSAERYAYSLLKGQPRNAKLLAGALADLHDSIGYCKKTFAIIGSDDELSELYTDPRRDKTLVMVVAEPFDILAIESTKSYTGTYHVLGGLLSPIDGVGPESLKIAELKERIVDDKVVEVILATNASVEGESTAMLVQSTLEGVDVKLTRLAQGLPIGVDLEYADQLTLSRALEGRREF
ncbi:MAG: recombination mediator RecR [Patescibacteria group bacterium]